MPTYTPAFSILPSKTAHQIILPHLALYFHQELPLVFTSTIFNHLINTSPHSAPIPNEKIQSYLREVDTPSHLRVCERTSKNKDLNIDRNLSLVARWI